MYKKLCLLALSVSVSATLLAQVRPTAEGGGGTAQIGAEISSFNPDYGCMHSSPFSCWNHNLMGISPYMDTGRFLFSKTALEVQARFLHWAGPGSLTESSYMVGPRVGLFHYRQASLNAKALVGRAHLAVPKGAQGAGSYFAYAPGGLIEYRLNPHIFLRGDYEYQIWANFKGIRTSTTDGTGALTPNGFSLGVSYALP